MLKDYVDRQAVSDACYEVFESVMREPKTRSQEEVKDILLRIEKAIKGVPRAEVLPIE